MFGTLGRGDFRGRRGSDSKSDGAVGRVRTSGGEGVEMTGTVEVLSGEECLSGADFGIDGEGCSSLGKGRLGSWGFEAPKIRAHQVSLSLSSLSLALSLSLLLEK